MFWKNKKQKQLEKTLEEIKREKGLLSKEKEELLKIKTMMENTNKPDVIDITNLYVFHFMGISSLAILEEENTIGGYRSKLIDIFTNNVIFEKDSIDRMEKIETARKYNSEYTARIIHIYEEFHDLLIYADKKVPKYILQQIYYELNDIDITNPSMQKYL